MSEVLDKQAIRKLAFTRCESKEHLHDWIEMFVGIDFPDGIVDPDSNSSPMSLIWEVYSKAMSGKDPDFTEVLAYAARDSYKTLAVSILEFMSIVHMDRDVAHVAAIQTQSDKAVSYIRDALKKPPFGEFTDTDNKRSVDIVWYTNRETGDIYTNKEFNSLSPNEQAVCERHSHYLHILVATVTGMNSEHVPFFCVDGKTKMLISKNGKRRRVASTARGVFQKLLTGRAGGRSPDREEVIEAPKVPIEVLGVDQETGGLAFGRITKAARLKKRTFRVRTVDGREILCAAEHPLFVLGRGFVVALELQVGDQVLVLNKGQTNSSWTAPTPPRTVADVPSGDTWEQVLLGSLLGDMGIYRVKTSNPYVAEQHCLEQAGYMNWKRKVLSQKLRTSDKKSATSGYTGVPLVGYYSGNSPLLLPYEHVRTRLDGVDRLQAIGLAVWYMDDGCAGNGFRLSTEGFSEDQNETLAQFLRERFGLDVSVGMYSRDDKAFSYIHGGIEAKRRLVEICEPYIHPDMAYKFDLKRNVGNCQHCGNGFFFYEEGRASKTCGSWACRGVSAGKFSVDTVVGVEFDSVRFLYDFVIEGTNTYWGNGVLNHNCLDEVDVIKDPKAFAEGKLIPTVSKGRFPITVMTSTRKYSFGLVQQTLDKHEKDPESKLQVRHWNLIDMTEACPPSRHLPNEPKIPIYYSKQDLLAISEAGYLALNSEKRKNFEPDEGYAGCLRNCKLFSVCRGRLATKQTGKSPLLRPLAHTINQFKTNETEIAQAQLMCWKPGQTGLVYPRFDREVHSLTADQIARRLFPDIPEDIEVDKAGLIKMALEHKLEFLSGLDWGFTHNFAVVTAIKYGNLLFVVDVIAQAGLELAQKLDVCNSSIRQWNPRVFADPEDPSSAKSFKNAGYRIVAFTKDVKLGIEATRWKLAPTLGGAPQLFFLKEDPQVEMLMTRLSKYHFTLDAAGEPTDIPDDKDDDECDALRYLCQNTFEKKNRVTTAPVETAPPGASSTPNQPLLPSTWMKEKISEYLGNSDGDDGVAVVKTGKKGNIVWDMG